MRDSGGRSKVSRKPVVRLLKQGATSHITQAAAKPRRRRVHEDGSPRMTKAGLANAMYEASLANAQATTGGFPGTNSQGTQGISGFGIDGNLALAASGGDFRSGEPTIIGDEAPAGSLEGQPGMFGPDRRPDGMRFNPLARLDASQVDDRRGDPRNVPVGYDPAEPISASLRQITDEMDQRFPGGRASKAAARRRGQFPRAVRT